MMPRTISIILVTALASAALALFPGCNKPPANAGPQAQQPAPFSTPQPQAAARETKEIELALALARILESAHRSGALIYRGNCIAERRIGDRYPLREPVKVEPMREALEEITHRYPELQWRDGANGVRLRDSAVTAGLLKVRLKEFALIEDREPEAALAALWSTPEVITYMAGHDVRFARHDPTPRARRKRAVVVVHVKDATVEEIVQRIVGSYPGTHNLWLYRECRAGAETVVEVKAL
jgi:hypothetical protein